MLNELVGQLLKSGVGEELLKTVQAEGLSPDQAKQAVTATAEGALTHMNGEGGVAGALGGLLGGGGGNLASMAAGLLGGASPQGGQAASMVSSLVPAVAQFVSQKTGLSLVMANTVVTVALPKIEALIRGGGVGNAGAPTNSGEGKGLAGLLGGLLG